MLYTQEAPLGGGEYTYKALLEKLFIVGLLAYSVINIIKLKHEIETD